MPSDSTVAFALEAGLLFGGMVMYLRATRPINSLGRLGRPIFGVVMLAIQGYLFFGPPPGSSVQTAITALAAYLLFAGIAQWLANQRKEAEA